jgi:hydrophobe/amphiphile efflux-1 (HAE1) family protein
MNLSDLAIRRPVFTTMVCLSLMVMGAIGFTRLGTDLLPEANFPLVTITTVFPGAGPEDVEKQLTKPIEDAVAGISGVKKLMSWSRESVSVVLIQFDMSAQIDGATQEVRERVASIRRSLPKQAEETTVARYDARAQPIVVYSVTGDGSPEKVREVIEDQLKPALEQVNGVALVKVSGGREREVRVLLDRHKLDALYLPVGSVLQALAQENVNIPSGHVRRGHQEVGVRADAQFKNVEEIRNAVVQKGQGQTPVYLRDVGEVVDGYKEQRVLVRTNGQEAVSVEVIKQAGANTMEVASLIKARILEVAPGLPLRLRADMMIDGSRMIRENAEEVEWAILYGGLMAILVILFFLLDVRGTLISATALPTAVIGTFAVMYALDYTLNLLTLIGLALAIGLLVDDAVVVREAITHRLERGEDPFTAARKGTAEVGLAVLATTLTICCVFVPVAFMSGMVGQFFRQFGFTITAAVLLSLFIAFTLDPMLSARFSLVRKPGERRALPVRVLERFFGRVEASYVWILKVVMRFKVTTLVLALGSLAPAGLLVNHLGFEFLPALDEAQFFVNIQFPPGTSLDEASRRSLVAEQAIMNHPEVVAVNATVGFSDQVRRVRYRVRTTEKVNRKVPLTQIKDDMRPILDRLPQATYSVADPIIIEGFADVAPIIMQIRGPDTRVLQRHAEKIADKLAALPGLVDVEIRDSPGLPEITVDVDRDRARQYGLVTSDVAIQARLALNGEVAGQMFTGTDDTVDIRVMLSEDFRRDPDALGQLKIYGPQGPVHLSDVARLRDRSGPAEINHEGRQRVIAVSAYTRGRALGKAVEDIHAALDGTDWGDGYELYYEGMQKEMTSSNADLLLALVLAILFIYMVLASQFESLTHPFTIVLSLPFAFTGAFVALWLENSPISVAANIGLILLMGLSTKNGILLVDGALQRMRVDHMDPTAAMMAAGPRRLRPILMTSAAMVLGMLPTALTKGAGSEFRGPMAQAVVGGVISNTILTLLVVPVIFVVMEGVNRAARRVVTRVAPSTALERPKGVRPADGPTQPA